ncbi:succinate dehydrogenase, hydrophobic membrane anchor protein [soil metagenome]
MSANLRDPIAIARGLGSAKDGTRHWWVQRLTAVALLLLSPWFAWLVLCLVGADQQAVRAAIASPLNASLLLAFVLSLSWHAQLGMQVIVEDYVHGWLEVALQLAIKFAYTLSALASILAIGRIVFTA